MPFVYSGVDFHCLLLSPRKRAIIFCKLISAAQRVTYQTCTQSSPSGSTPTFATLGFIAWSLCERMSSLDFSILGVSPVPVLIIFEHRTPPVWLLRLVSAGGCNVSGFFFFSFTARTVAIFKCEKNEAAAAYCGRSTIKWQHGVADAAHPSHLEQRGGKERRQILNTSSPLTGSTLRGVVATL